jgi:hypothetical protein
MCTYVDSLVGKTWWNRGALFFGIAEQLWKLLDSGHRYVSTIVPGK